MTRAAGLAVLLQLLVLPALPAAAATPSPTQALSPGPSASAAPVKRPAAVSRWSGFYFTDRMLAAAGATAATVRASTPCGELVTALTASQWNVHTRLPAPYLATISRGDSFGLLSAGGDAGLCAATIQLGSMQSVSTSGPVTFNGRARMYPLQCIQVAGSVSLQLIYEGAPDFRMMLTVDLPAAAGAHTITGDNLHETIVGQSTSTVFDTFKQQDTSSSEDVPSWAHSFTAAEGAPAGSVTIQSMDPLTGEISLTTLVDQAGNPGGIKAGFRCSPPPQ